MPRFIALASLAWISATLFAACGTADQGSATASPADAQATIAAPETPAEPGAPALDAPAGTLPRPPSGGGKAEPVSGGPCASDADCVPASCCHPKTCVAKAQKPSCEGMMCTMDCRAGTLDCGGGKCVCQNGTCAAELRTPGFVKGIEGNAPAQLQ